MIKKGISIGLLIILVSYQFAVAAIVSDNDGSAFVTKSEFEQLKSDFNNQITNYNLSIDKRIDGAIASYLAGVKLSQTIEEISLLNKINNGCDDSYIESGIEKKYGYRCMAKKYSVPTTQEPIGAITGAFFQRSIVGATSGSPFVGGWQRVGLTYETRGHAQEIDIPSAGRQNGIYLLMSKYNDKYYLTNNLADITYKYYVSGNAAAHTLDYPPFPSQTWVWTLPEFKDESDSWVINYCVIDTDWGGTSPGGVKCMYGATYIMDKTLSVVPVCGKITGTVIGLENDKIKNKKLQTSSHNWSWYPSSQLFNYSKTSGSWTGSAAMPVAALNGTFHFNCHPYETVTLSDLIDYNATVAYGEGDVSIYGGLPLFKATDSGEATIKITFKSKDNHDVYVGLQKSQFANDETYTIASSLNLRNEMDIKYADNKFSSGIEYTFKIDVNRDDVVWIKTYDASSDTAFTGAVTNSIILINS